MRRIGILLADLIIIYGCIILSFILLRDEFLLNYKDNIGAFYYVSPFILPVYFLISYVFGMVSLQRKSVLEVWYTVFIVSLALTISIMALIFLMRDKAESYPRSIIFLSAVLYFILLSLWRISLQKIYQNWHGRRTAMIIGNGYSDISGLLKTKYKNLYQVKYIVAGDDSSASEKAREVNDIFITDEVTTEIREQLLLISNDSPDVNIYFIPKISDIAIINSRLFPFGDIPVQQIGKLFLRQEELFVKRIIDIIVSILCLILFAPFFIIIPVLIKLDGGPVFFIQERLTMGRRKFHIIKFRTMTPDAERMTGPTLSARKDRRITAIGKVLRTTRFDELPQFWNILRGDMSLVGPRPERPYFAEKIEAELPEFKYRLHVKAGLTGLAQVMGKYNTDFRQKLHYDLYYINNFSIFRDILIMLQTVKIIFWKENVEGVRENTTTSRLIKESVPNT